jgi:hypothetical protein
MLSAFFRLCLLETATQHPVVAFEIALFSSRSFFSLTTSANVLE